MRPVVAPGALRAQFFIDSTSTKKKPQGLSLIVCHQQQFPAWLTEFSLSERGVQPTSAIRFGQISLPNTEFDHFRTVHVQAAPGGRGLNLECT